MKITSDLNSTNCKTVKFPTFITEMDPKTMARTTMKNDLREIYNYWHQLRPPVIIKTTE